MMDATTDIEALRRELRSARSTLDQRTGQRDGLLRQRKALGVSLSDFRESKATTEKVVLLLKEASEYARELTRQQVEMLTTLALQAVFGESYRFSLVAGQIGATPTITCEIVSPYTDGQELSVEGTDSTGGGITDVEAMALRVAMLETVQPHLDGPLFLDEPGKHVSKGFREFVGRFIRAIADQFGRQMIFVTHDTDLAAMADQCIEVVLVDTASVVSEAT